MKEYTIAELARELGVHRSTVFRWYQQQKILPKRESPASVFRPYVMPFFDESTLIQAREYLLTFDRERPQHRLLSSSVVRARK